MVLLSCPIFVSGFSFWLCDLMCISTEPNTVKRMAKSSIFHLLFIEHKSSPLVYLMHCLTSTVKIHKRRAAAPKGGEYLKHIMYQCEENVVVFLVSVLKKNIEEL